MINKYIETQNTITNLLLKSMNNNKLVQAYMFYSNDIEFLLDYAKDFSKDLICEKENLQVFKKIDNNTYEELVLIEPINNMIRIDQINKLKNFFLTKPVIGKRKIYIIKNCEKLNVVAANAMLKFIEDQEEDIIGIFLTTNIDLVLPTIKSRCQILNFKKENETDYSFLTIEEAKRNEILYNALLFIENLIKNNINIYYRERELLFDKFKEKKEIEELINILLYFYYDTFIYKINEKTKYFKNEAELKLIKEEAKNTIDNITSKIFIIENIKNDYKYNLNTKLLFDRIILELGEVKDEIC